MKILFIIPDYGSFDNFLGEVAVELLKQQHQVDVICADYKIIKKKDKFLYQSLGVNIHIVAISRGFNLFKHYAASRKIHEIIQYLKPDVIHAHFMIGIFTTVLFRRPEFKTLGTLHGVGSIVADSFLKKQMFKQMEAFCIKRLSQIWVLNKLDYDSLQKEYSTKVHLLPTAGLGCHLEMFDPYHWDFHLKQDLRNRLKINEDDFVITFTGRFIAHKGFDTLIRAFIQLMQHTDYKNIKLMLIGGVDDLHPTGLTLDEEAWFFNHPNIILIGFTSEVAQYLAVSNLFVMPSLKEGMPVSIMEALAMGLPVITSDNRGCNDLIKDGLNGVVLSDKPTATELCNSIIAMKNNENKRKNMTDYIIKNREYLDRKLFVSHEIMLYNSVVN